MYINWKEIFVDTVNRLFGMTITCIPPFIFVAILLWMFVK